jgi:hypothetical protein
MRAKIAGQFRGAGSRQIFRDLGKLWDGLALALQHGCPLVKAVRVAHQVSHRVVQAAWGLHFAYIDSSKRAVQIVPLTILLVYVVLHDFPAYVYQLYAQSLHSECCRTGVSGHAG